MINLGDFGSTIGKINGKPATSYMVLGVEMIHIHVSRFTVLPPGDYSFGVSWVVTSTRTGYNNTTITTQSASSDITATLLPGHYYYLFAGKVDSKSVLFQIDDLKNVQEVSVSIDNKLASSKKIPSKDVIAGIDAKIKKRE